MTGLRQVGAAPTTPTIEELPVDERHRAEARLRIGTYVHIYVCTYVLM